MKPAFDLSIIIVNWNSREFLRKCLQSLDCADLVGLSLEIVVIDSGSFDGSQELVETGFSHVRFIQSESNLGFAKANNVAAASAGGEFLLFLNPDTEAEPASIALLLKHARALPQLGLMGPRLLNSDGTLQTSCVQPMPTILNQLLDLDVLLKPLSRFPAWINAASFEGSAGPVTVPAISGACMLLRASLFNAVGGFSTEYFMYAEDLDLCWKARRAGKTNYYLATANVVHHGGGSTRNSRNRFAEVMIPQSLTRLLTKANGRLYGAAYRVAMSGNALLRVLLLILLFPLVAMFAGFRRWAMTLGKWAAVFRWSVGLERWSRRTGQA